MFLCEENFPRTQSLAIMLYIREKYSKPTNELVAMYIVACMQSINSSMKSHHSKDADPTLNRSSDPVLIIFNASVELNIKKAATKSRFHYGSDWISSHINILT